MIAPIITLLAAWRVPAHLQRFLAWLIIIAVGALLIWGTILLFRGWVQDGKDEAIEIDRIESESIARNAQLEAERKAAHDKHVDELVAERALAEQREAINATEHEPDGDPWAALLNRL